MKKLLCLLSFLFCVIDVVHAQQDLPLSTDQITRFQVTTIDCKDPNDICKIEVIGRLESDHTRASSGTIVCGMKYYNFWNYLIATFEIRQNTTFYNQYGRSPFSWNGFPTVNTWGATGAVWIEGSSTIFPASGVQSSMGYSLANATLTYLGVPQGRTVSINFGSYGSPYSCSGT